MQEVLREPDQTASANRDFVSEYAVRSRYQLAALVTNMQTIPFIRGRQRGAVDVRSQAIYILNEARPSETC